MTLQELIDNPSEKPGSAGTIKDERQVEVVAREWWKARSPRVSLESYDEHPLAVFKGDWWARVMRGSEGVMGSLDYALMDIGIGLLQGAWEAVKRIVPKAGGGGGA